MGNILGWYIFIFNFRFSWMLLSCLGPAVPQVRLVSLTSDSDSELLAGNEELSRLVGRLAWPRLTVLSLPLAAGHSLEVRLYLPAQLREGQPYKYPLLLHTWVFTEWQRGNTIRPARWIIKSPPLTTSHHLTNIIRSGWLGIMTVNSPQCSALCTLLINILSSQAPPAWAAARQGQMEVWCSGFAGGKSQRHCDGGGRERSGRERRKLEKLVGLLSGGNWYWGSIRSHKVEQSTYIVMWISSNPFRSITSIYPIDEEKISVYGQNYGGFLALRMMVNRGRGEQLFSCAILRSPVIDWRHHGNWLLFSQLSSLTLLPLRPIPDEQIFWSEK